MPVALMIESFFLPDFKFDFFLSDFCLLYFVPLSYGVFIFSTFEACLSFFNEVDDSCDFKPFLLFFYGLFCGLLYGTLFYGASSGLPLLLCTYFSSFS
jgi:hypothetical protein